MSDQPASPGGQASAREVFSLALSYDNQFVNFRLVRPKEPTRPPGREFSLHRAEAKKLVRELERMLAAGDGSVSLVEGAYDGPPIERHELLNPDD